MSLRIRQEKFAQNIVKLLLFATEKGYTFTFGEADRTESQAVLYYTGYTVVYNKAVNLPELVKDVRRSKTMLSKHLDRLAFDINFFKNGKWLTTFDELKELGDYWESLDPINVWGGDFNKNDIEDGFVDVPHFQG